jgi:hypothetical protein
MLVWKGFCKINMVAVILCDSGLQLPFLDPNLLTLKYGQVFIS